MLQGNINNIGELVIILKEHNDNDVLQCVTLQNKTEFNFLDDELVSIVFPKFHEHYPYGPCNENTIVDVKDISINHQNILIVNLNIGGYDLSLTVDVSLFENRNI